MACMYVYAALRKDTKPSNICRRFFHSMKTTLPVSSSSINVTSSRSKEHCHPFSHRHVCWRNSRAFLLTASHFHSQACGSIYHKTNSPFSKYNNPSSYYYIRKESPAKSFSHACFPSKLPFHNNNFVHIDTVSLSDSRTKKKCASSFLTKDTLLYPHQSLVTNLTKR